MPLPSEQLEALLKTARSVRECAYAPYSEYSVGSALLTSDGRIFSGCNVENLSFGLTICAERNAIAAAVAAGMQVGQLRAIAVVGETLGQITPCGACRQVIAEFACGVCVVIGAGPRGDSETWSVEELLPHRFRAEL